MLAVLPALFHWAAPRPILSRTTPAVAFGYAACALICYLLYRSESKRLGRSRAAVLVFLIFLLSSFTNNLHNYYVDRHGTYVPHVPNLRVQEDLQNEVIQLLPGAVPHSYRFLPNAIVRWIELCGVEFAAARDIYRAIAGVLLFFALYRYASLFTDYVGAMFALLLVAAVYPISFEWYAGQLTDPLSHLSFVLALIFLETENFPLLLSTLLIGSLAKETVLALAGFYVLFRRGERNYAAKATVLCVASLAVFFGVRMFVLHGSMQYQQVSGVSAAHIFTNWKDVKWPAMFVITACAYAPFLAIAWKETPGSLKRMAFYLYAVLFPSSLVFSWLSETRNFMPLVFVLSVIAGRYLSRHGAVRPEHSG